MTLKNKPGKNRGELSELYAHLMILKEGRIFEADENLIRDEKLHYTVKSILGGNNAEGLKYEINEEENRIDIVKDEEVIGSVSRADLISDTEYIERALDEPSEKGTIHVDLDTIVNRWGLTGISAGANTKIDIVVELYDPHLGMVQALPFSIKSFIGSHPTLLNASGATNFTFRIKGDLSDSDIDEINNMVIQRGSSETHTDLRGRIRTILSKGCELEYARTSDMYEGNLRAIDSWLPEILARMIILRFIHEKNSIPELVDILNRENPMGYIGEQEFYRIKISRLLMDSFMGMKPGVIWDGRAAVHGGYLIIKPDKEVVCFHLSNRNKFEDYLFNRCILDTPSTSRYGFGRIYEENGELFFRINQSIRMK